MNQNNQVQLEINNTVNNLGTSNDNSEDFVFNPFKHTDGVTKTEKTKNAYIKRAIVLVKKVAKEVSNRPPENVDPRQVVAWLQSIRKEISRNTFRQYKSALMFYFLEILKTDIALEAAEYLMPLSSEMSLEKGTKTSANKAKHMKQSKFNDLITYLLTKEVKYYEEIICWLQAGLLCGLRPAEWRNAELIKHNGEQALKVLNAKNTNGRANGDYRIIVLSGISTLELNIIKQQIYNIKKYDIGEEGYERFYYSCANALSHANNALFGKKGKHITLYSARHQFSANAKASNASKSAVAALMGHATDDTANSYYGKRRFGAKGGLKVAPIQEQVETVKKVENTFMDERLQLFAEIKRQKEITQVGLDFDNITEQSNENNNNNSIKL